MRISIRAKRPTRPSSLLLFGRPHYSRGFRTTPERRGATHAHYLVLRPAVVLCCPMLKHIKLSNSDQRLTLNVTGTNGDHVVCFTLKYNRYSYSVICAGVSFSQ